LLHLNMIGEINVPKYYKQISWKFTLFSHGNKNKKFVDRRSLKKIHFPTSPFPSSWLLNILGIFKSKIHTSKKNHWEDTKFLSTGIRWDLIKVSWLSGRCWHGVWQNHWKWKQSRTSKIKSAAHQLGPNQMHRVCLGNFQTWAS